MKKSREFCCYCGKQISQREIEGKPRDYCVSCGTVFYENPLPVASSIVVNEKREVLLVKRKNEPYRDMWCLPMGFAESGEEVREAALRELEEEAGIRGEIIELIDVDTVDNYFYGSLVIVAYEVRHTGGRVKAGDDAMEAKYFPVNDFPPLAWTSNEKAMQLYINLYRDLWDMADSVKRLLPDETVLDEISPDRIKQERFLSNIIVQIIEKHITDISEQWMLMVTEAIPSLNDHIEDLVNLNRNIMRAIQFWLKRGGDTLGLEEFIESGIKLREKDIPLPELITAMALSRKSIWMHIVRERIPVSYTHLRAHET